MRRRTVIVAIAAVLTSAVLAQHSFAGGQTYVDKRRVIRAGALILKSESAADVPPAAPFIFYIMGLRDDLKPHGWTFVNPLATGSETYKNAAAYWMVNLQQTTLENLAKFDVLYMSAKQLVMFPMAERDKLRRFVDGGGCLWVDNGGGMKFSTNPAYAFFLPDVNFSGPTPVSSPPSVASRLHPLVTSPFWLSPQEIASLGLPAAGGLYTINPGFKRTWGSSLPGPTILSPVVVVGSDASSDVEPTIAAIEYGSGRIVFTSGFIGGKIEGPVTGWSAPLALTAQNSKPLMASQPDLRFAYNVVSWATSYTTLRKAYRRNGMSLESVSAPLVNKWKLPGAAPSSGGADAPEISPVLYKNVIFYSAGNTLYALDASPENDLDMDGNPNDGYQDIDFPQQDIIWKADLEGPISSPTVASMLDPRGGTLAPKDFVLVTCQSDHLVYIFEAFPQDDKGRLSGAPIPRDDLWQMPEGALSGSGMLLPPVVQNGWIYAVAGGKIYGHSPVLAAAPSGIGDIPETPWTCPLSAVPDTTATIRSGPTFGFVKNKTNGAVVQMLYVVARPPDIGGSGITVVNDHIYALPVFVSSDRLTPVDPKALEVPGGATGQVDFRTSYGMGQARISSYPEPQAWGINPDGSAVDLNVTVNAATPGIVKIQAASGARPLGPNTRVYMTYAIDYGQSGVIYVPPSFEIPPNMGWSATSGGALELQAGATPALGPNDALYLGVLWNNSGMLTGTGKSSVDAIVFDGNRSTAKLKWSYFLHGGGTFTDPTTSAGGNMGGRVTIPDINPATGEPTPGGLGIWGVCARLPDGSIHPVRNLEVKTTPAVTGDRVFVTATTTDPGTSGLSKGYLLCFKADPSFVIRLSQPLQDPTTGRKFSVRIWQPDLLFDPASAGEPPLSQATPVPSDMIDYDTGTITITDFNRVRLRGSPLGSGMATNTITPSLPVWVFVDNQPVAMSQVDLSSWDNLLWSLALPRHGDNPCSGVSSSPIVLGDYVYFTCNDGYMYAVAVDAMPRDKKLKMLDPADEDASVWMPMNDRIDPSASPGGNTGKVSVAGGAGALVVPCSTGLYLFYNPLTLVTDNHRVLEIGGDGKVSWACDSVYEPKEVSGALPVSSTSALYGLDRTSLNRPTVAQKLAPSDYLVVDSGNDRIIRMDRGGQVTWSLTSFEDPKNLLRSGEPKRLKAPSDAKMWTEFEKTPDGNWFYLVHCLVADSGNFRIVDVVDKFDATADGRVLGPVTDANGRPIGHQLYWVSETTYTEKRLMFNCIQLVQGVTDKNGQQVSVNQIWASAINYGLTGVAPETPQTPGGGHLGGAIVSMKYRESEEPFQWKYIMGEPASSLTGQLTALDDGGKPLALSGPTYFAVLDSGLPRLLICDSSAVYLTEGPKGIIKWRLTADNYAKLTRSVRRTGTTPEQRSVAVPFSPQRAQLLPGGRLIVVNGYAGRTYDPLLHKFTGEVFEINTNDPAPQTIKWYTPEMWYDDPPTEIMQKMPNAPNLDQPTCAQRLF